MRTLEQFITESLIEEAKFEPTTESKQMANEIAQAITKYAIDKIENGFKKFHPKEIDLQKDGYDGFNVIKNTPIIVQYDKQFEKFLEKFIKLLIEDIEKECSGCTQEWAAEKNPEKRWSVSNFWCPYMSNYGVINTMEKEFEALISKYDLETINKIKYVSSGAAFSNQKISYENFLKEPWDWKHAFPSFLAQLLNMVTPNSEYNIELELECGTIKFDYYFRGRGDRFDIYLGSFVFKPAKKSRK